MRCASGTAHRGRQRVAQLVPVDWTGTSDGGLAVYMTQWVGRGVVSQYLLATLVTEGVYRIT